MFLRTCHYFQSHTECLVALLWPCCLFDLVSYSSLPTFPVGKTIAPFLMRSGCGHPFLHDLYLLKIFEPKCFCLGKFPIFYWTCAHSPLLPLNADSCWHLWGLPQVWTCLWWRLHPTTPTTSALMARGCLPHLGELFDGNSDRCKKRLWDMLGLNLVLMTWKLSLNISTSWSTIKLITLTFTFFLYQNYFSFIITIF